MEFPFQEIMNLCQDSQEIFLAASLGADNYAARYVFNQLSLERLSFILELHRYAMEFGKKPTVFGTCQGLLNRVWLNLLQLVTNKPNRIYYFCAKRERRLLKAYREILKGDFQKEIKSVIWKQYSRLLSSGARLAEFSPSSVIPESSTLI